MQRDLLTVMATSVSDALVRLQDWSDMEDDLRKRGHGSSDEESDEEESEDERPKKKVKR